MRKLHIVCLILINCGLFFHCKNSMPKQKHEKQYDSILDYFKTRQKIILKPTTSKLFILTENGCMSCNKEFSEVLSHCLSDTSCVFLIGTQGSYIDITRFAPSKNVFIDQSLTETGYTFFHQSKIIYLNNTQIDTILTINAREMIQQLEFIKSKKKG